MQINTAGTYEIEYTATDDCGNTTTLTQTLTVIDKPTPRTVLYNDGTFIINELSSDREANIALHGEATNVYPALDADHDYVFTQPSEIPWASADVFNAIHAVEIGSEIHPTSTAYWFFHFINCTSFDLDLLDTSGVASMEHMFSDCNSVETLDVSGFDTTYVENMYAMFSNCNALTSLDLTNFDTSNVLNMTYMFYGCIVMTSVDLTNFDTSNVTSMSTMFYGCYQLTSLDLSSFDTSSLEECQGMFQSAHQLVTIYASETFVTDNVTSDSNMFANCDALVGGAGTVYNSNYVDKTYARIDEGTENPGYFTAIE